MEREYFKNQLFWIFDMGKRNRTIFEFWNYGMVDKQIAHEIQVCRIGKIMIARILLEREIDWKIRSYFLSFEGGSRLEIMNKPDMEDVKKTLNWTGLIHIAFSVGSKEKVDELTMKLEEAGYPVVSGPRTTGDGYYESCVVAIEENQIEITV